MNPRVPRVAATAALCTQAFSAMCVAAVAVAPEDAPQEHGAALEFGIDRSNMGTQWTLAWPQEPNVSPFLKAEYNKPGNFEARRVAVLDGIARLHVQWFRDGFGKGSPDLFVDLLKLVHARGMKMLTVFGPAASDYPPGAYLSNEKSGCQWGTYPLSKINMDAYQKRIEEQFAAVRAAGETVDAFEIGNEFDLYCNDADSPTGAEWAKHQWKWFLSPTQVETFVRGYGPYLAASVASIRKYFPQAKVITYGNSMPASAPLIEALASVRDANGKIIDYTRQVDGYGSHLYPVSDTTLNMVEDTTNALRYEAAHYPRVNQRPIWITEWNPTGSSWWNGRPWYFQYDARGRVGGDLNKADAHGVYKEMDRAAVIRVFHHELVEKLRAAATAPVNISQVFYYSYDSAGKSPKCDHVKDSRMPDRPGLCVDGVIDPSTGNLLPDVGAAVSGAAR
jgi:hypothetical protein